VLQYYANLFLGAEEQARGRDAAARRCYEAAAAQYPLAQSPYLALCQLARQSGGRQAALATLRLALKPPSSAEPNDPWCAYYRSAGRHAAAIFDQARRACLEAEKR
jgi:hypothetical protein